MKGVFLRFFTIITLLFIVAFSFFGCSNYSENTLETKKGTVYFNKENAHYSSLLIFGTSLNYYVEGDFYNTNNRTLFVEMATKIEERLEEIENIVDIKSDISEISAFNNYAVSQPFIASEQFIRLILKSQELYNLTNYFSPTLLNYSNLWKLSSATYDGIAPTELPSTENLQKLNHVSDFSTILIHQNTLTKTAQNVIINGKNYTTCLDFGAICKGYCLDVINDYFKSYGYLNGYVDFGKSSINLLNRKNGDWNLSIKNPRGENAVIKITGVNNAYVSTSGDYETFYIKDNVRYSHLIDATTGRPYQNSILSATVIGSSGYYTDGLSTALCTMGIENAISFTNSHLKDIGYKVFITVFDGEYKIFTNAPLNSITLTDSQYKLVTF